MRPILDKALLSLPLVVALLGCNGGGDSGAAMSVTGPGEIVSSTTPVFVLDPDPTKVKIPLPNILATATATDPLTGRSAGNPISVTEALAYLNVHEMGGVHAVSGINAPIFIQFNAPVNENTVNASNIKVFQLTPDAAGTENNPLGFTDISATFSYRYVPGSTDLFLFPEFPLKPGTRYLYVVTNRVMDQGTPSKPITASVTLEILKSVTPLTGLFAGMEPVRADILLASTRPYDSATNPRLLRGYARVMDDLITPAAGSSPTTISTRSDITLLGRFITTGSGAISMTHVTPSATDPTTIPVETSIRAFAFGAANGLQGLLAGKTWTNSITVPANNPPASVSTFVKGTPLSPDLYWSKVFGSPTAAPASVGTVVLGTFNSADLSIDPVVAMANAPGANLSTMNLSAVTGAYNPAAGVLQGYRLSNNLVGFYHTDRAVPFIYIAPDPTLFPGGMAPAGGWPVTIFQHGVTSQKETVVAIAQAVTQSGRAVIAIDLPHHGQLAGLDLTGAASDPITINGLATTKGAVWGNHWMALGYPLATRTNIQQSAFNLHRLEFTLRAGAFAAGVPASAVPSQTNFNIVGHSLGSIVGAYYLAGNTTLDPTPGNPPYQQSSLDTDMKGYLAVPAGRLAYTIQNSPFFGSQADAGLAAPPPYGPGIVKNSTAYHQFFLVTQSVIDPCDPATITTPLAPGLPSRLSNRITIQEATTKHYQAQVGSDLLPVPVVGDGDQVITNAYTRYFATALGGREILGTTPAAAAVVNKIAPLFKQLAYTAGGTYTVAANPVSTAHAAGPVGPAFLQTLGLTGMVDKVAPAAFAVPAAGNPTEGFFQFDQTEVGHSSLLDPTLGGTISPANGIVNTTLIQRQVSYFLAAGVVVDPTQSLAPAPELIQSPGNAFLASPKHSIFGN